MSSANRGYPIPDLINPGNEITFCVPVPNDERYIRAFWGQMSELGAWGIWHKDGTRNAVNAATRWRDSYARIGECIQDGDCPDLCSDDCCVTFTTTDPHIEYAPNDPYQTPDHVPFGYLLPPWTLHDDRPSVSLLSLPTGVLGIGAIISGFPRFKVRFKGAGTVQLYLRRQPQGGLAYITLDGNPIGQVVNMASWQAFDYDTWLLLIASLVPGVALGSLWSSDIIEVSVSGAGDHYIDVTAIPNINPDVLLGFGFELEKIRICTDEEQEILEFMPPQMRLLEGCMLQWRPNSDADWVDLGDVCGTNGIDGTCPDICADETTLGTPINLDWYCRAAKVFAEQIYRQAVSEVARVLATEPPIGLYSYPFENMLPYSVRLDQYFQEGQGAWNSIDADGWEAWDDVTNDTTYETRMLSTLRKKLECIFKDVTHSDASYTEHASDSAYTLAAFIQAAGTNLVSVHPHTSLELNEAADNIAIGLFYWFAPYAAMHFDNMLLALNYEANISTTWGVETCLEDCAPEVLYADTFADAGLGLKTKYQSEVTPAPYYAASDAVWSNAVGYGTPLGALQSVTANSPYAGKSVINVWIDLGFEETILQASYRWKGTGNTGDTGQNIAFFNASGTLVLNAVNHTVVSSTSWTTESWSGSQTGVRYIRYACVADISTAADPLYMDDISVFYEDV